ncbi:hypothetical protein GGR58DRAFT_472264 [Xylaria digitata]|nr:hypothetical protein GGR58DRAFT_472264 [Xylaria digitata]
MSNPGGTLTSDSSLSPKRKLVHAEAFEDLRGPQSHRSEQPRVRSGARKFSCPFAKLDPTLGGSHQEGLCHNPGWNSIHRVKEHLYRKHSKYSCDRCFISFDTQEEVKDHRRNPESCRLLPTPARGDPSIGFDQEKLKSLRRRSRGVNEYEKWYEMWNVLFPTISPPDTPYCSENTSLQRTVSDVILELRTDLLGSIRSAAQPQSGAVTSLTLGNVEHIIQTSTDNALKKWAPDSGATESPFDRSPPAKIGSSKAASDGDASHSAPQPPTPSTAAHPEAQKPPDSKARVGVPAWNKYRDVLKKLYVDDGNPLPIVVKTMEEKYGFVATIKQYRYQFGERWGWKKYNGQLMQKKRPHRGYVGSTGAEQGDTKSSDGMPNMPPQMGDCESGTQGFDTSYTSLDEPTMTEATESTRGASPVHSSSSGLINPHSAPSTTACSSENIDIQSITCPGLVRNSYCQPSDALPIETLFPTSGFLLDPMDSLNPGLWRPFQEPEPFGCVLDWPVS